MAVHATVAGRSSFSSIVPEVAAPFSFESLYRDFGPWILQICKQRLGNHPDAEDACQETILKAYVAMPRFRQGARLSPWLATIAVNTCTDIQRRQARLDPLDEVADEEALDVEEETCRSLRKQIVREALPLVPQNYRTYIYLRDFDGWSYEQIGRFYGVSIASVRSTLLRARRALKEKIRKIAEKKGQWPLPALIPSAWLRFRSFIRQKTVSARNLLSNWVSRISSLNCLEATVTNTFIANVAAAAVTIGIVVGTLVLSSARSAQPDDIMAASSLSDLNQREFGAEPWSRTASSLSTPAKETDATAQSEGEEGASGINPAGVNPSSTESAGSSTTAAEAGQTSVTVTISPGNNDDDTTETSSVSVSTDVNGDQNPDAGVGKGPTGINCPPPEERGTVTAVACPVLEDSQDALDEVESAIDDATSGSDGLPDDGSVVPAPLGA